MPKSRQLRSARRPLASLRERIERVVPLSPGNYNRKVTGAATRAVSELERLAREENVHPDRYANTPATTLAESS